MYAKFLFELLLTALINPQNVIYIGSLAKKKRKQKYLINDKEYWKKKIIKS